MRLLRACAVVAVLSVIVGLVPAQASAGESWNDYSIVGLPPFISVETTFTVGIDGPNAVCSMTYHANETESAVADVTLTAPPWTFVAKPTHGWAGWVSIIECGPEGYGGQVQVETRLPFDVAPTVIAVSGVTTARAKAGNVTLTVTNYMDVAAVAVVVAARGRVVAQAGIAPRETAGGVVSDPTAVNIPLKALTSSSQLTITVTGDNGIAMTRRIVLARGWAPFYGMRQFAAPCSTVSWSFSTKRQPRADNTMKKDVVGALARLSKLTGLKFVEVPPTAKAPGSDPWTSVLDASSHPVIQYVWSDLGAHGPSGTGSTSGTVTLNNKDFWPKNANAGFSFIRGYFPGRGWLIVHETMHVLGFDHVNDKTQLMNPVGYVARFGKGDLGGLRALYPKAGCAA